MPRRTVVLCLNHHTNTNEQSYSFAIVDENIQTIRKYVKLLGNSNFRCTGAKSKSFNYREYKTGNISFYDFLVWKNDGKKKTFGGTTVLAKYEALLDILRNLKVSYIEPCCEHFITCLGEMDFFKQIRFHAEEFRHSIVRLQTYFHVSEHHPDGYYLIVYPSTKGYRNSSFHLLREPEKLSKILLRETVKSDNLRCYLVRNFSSIENIPFVSILRERNMEIKLANIMPHIDNIFHLRRG